jgi:ATP-dependent DNA helicase RecG
LEVPRERIEAGNGQEVPAEGDRKAQGDLAITCVCFANARGGIVLIGIEDDDGATGRTNDRNVASRLSVGRLASTVNVTVVPKIAGDNGAEYIEVAIPRSTGVASTPMAAITCG